jgi:hypothetical protein
MRMLKMIKVLGFLVYQGARGGLRLTSYLVGLVLDAIYGPPQLLGVQVPSGAERRQLVAGYTPTIALEADPSPMRVAAAKVAEKGLVLSPAKAELTFDGPFVSARVAVAEVCGPTKLVYGVMWLYLYPERKIAKRVFKVTDRKLVKLLNSDRYYLPDVPYEARKGTSELLLQMHLEVSKILNKNPSVMRQKKQQPVPDVAKVVAPVQVQRPIATASPAPLRTQQVEVPAPAFKRNVEGDVYQGVVSVAGSTRMPGRGGRKPYDTFCLTLNDMGKETPLFGAELERQVNDMQIRPGERVRVVFMGKSKVDIPGSETPAYKNLYQITRA